MHDYCPTSIRSFRLLTHPDPHSLGLVLNRVVHRALLNRFFFFSLFTGSWGQEPTSKSFLIFVVVGNFFVVFYTVPHRILKLCCTYQITLKFKWTESHLLKKLHPGVLSQLQCENKLLKFPSRCLLTLGRSYCRISWPHDLDFPARLRLRCQKTFQVAGNWYDLQHFYSPCDPDPEFPVAPLPSPHWLLPPYTSPHWSATGCLPYSHCCGNTLCWMLR